MTDRSNSYREVTVVPYGGLCNRLNAIVAACALAESSAVDVKILWAKKKWCNCAFSDLFQPLHLERVTIHDVTSLPFLWQRSLPRNLYQAGTIRGLMNIKNIENLYPEYTSQELMQIINAHSRVYISSCVRFLPYDRDISHLFTPHADNE